MARILIIDDSPTELHLFQGMLEKQGFDVLLADSGEEGIRQALSRLSAGDDPQTILDDLAEQWDELTERIGVEKQQRVYADWASKPNAYPSN